MATHNVTTSQKCRGTNASSHGRSNSSTSLGNTATSLMDAFFLSPYYMMRGMFEQMDRAFGATGSSTAVGSTDSRSDGCPAWTPAISVAEQDDHYIVRAELPGVEPDEVKVEVRDNRLVLEGERKLKDEEEQREAQETEIRYGRFFRSIPLPERVMADRARAKFENGILEITMPVHEQTGRKQISVEASSSSSHGKTRSSGESHGSGKAA